MDACNACARRGPPEGGIKVTERRGGHGAEWIGDRYSHHRNPRLRGPRRPTGLPDRLPDQVTIIRKLIGTGDRNVAAPYDAESLSALFGWKNKKRTERRSSEFIELLPILAWRRAVQKLVGELVAGDAAGGGIEVDLRVHLLGDYAEGHGLAERSGHIE